MWFQTLYEGPAGSNSWVWFVSVPRLSAEAQKEEARCDYESYRTLVKNLFHKVSEPDALTKIDVEEMYIEPSKKGKKKKKSK